jgi:hypothetical protein
MSGVCEKFVIVTHNHKIHGEKRHAKGNPEHGLSGFGQVQGSQVFTDGYWPALAATYFSSTAFQFTTFHHASM